MKRILITAFEPFGGEQVNPSYEAMMGLDPSDFDANIHRLKVPTVFYRSAKTIIEAIDAFHPDIIIMIGQAGGRKEISLERIGINLDDSSMPDNEGVVLEDHPIALFGPDAYFSTLPNKAIVKALKQAHIPAKVSNSAGTYVCNHVLYQVLHHLAQIKGGSHIKAGFIHVPYMKKQVIHRSHLFSLELPILIQTLKIAIETTLKT